MTTVVTRGAASAQALGYASSSAAVNYIEDVFSTYLYTGNGSTQTITNGIDLSGKGGLVWCKKRSTTQNHYLTDTVQGTAKQGNTNTTAAFTSNPDVVTAFSASGFSVGSTEVNDSAATYASWTFREQPKFFDVVTWTGNGVAGRQIPHNLGSVPGCIIVKCTSTSPSWAVWHRSLSSQFGLLNLTNAFGTSNVGYTTAEVFGDDSVVVQPTSTNFTVASSAISNGSPSTYVAYLFAHDAGGFGLTGTDNVISCGSFTTDGSGNATVSLGYEPQWFLRKQSSGVNDWVIFDNMRGWSLSDDAFLYPNSSSAEASANRGNPTATGFTLTNQSASADFIYIAIRRGPMKVPTDATKVFNTVLQSPQSAGTVRTVGFPADLVIGNIRAGSGHYFQDRLRGFPSSGTTQNTLSVQSQSTAAEASAYPYFYDVWNTTAKDGDLSFMSNGVGWNFGRAPGFFDEVCYTGSNSVPITISHNLTVAPELLICKGRTDAAYWGDLGWIVYHSAIGATKYLVMNTTAAPVTLAGVWNNTAPTSSVFTLGTDHLANSNNDKYVAYLFATCPGVSKVGSYTGTGTTLQINCGFTAGSRFVLIKRTDSTGDWYVWDSARGIVAGNDPYLLLNSTAAEDTSTDYVDTYSAGFEISSTAPAAINANGGSFIFFAVS